MSADLSGRGGELSGAKLGPCRACRDYTVLPAFGDGRCFGCTSDELSEPEWATEQQVLVREPEEPTVIDEIQRIFAEAQLRVTTARALIEVTGRRGSGSIRRNAGWPTRLQRRWRAGWTVVTPRDLMREGAEPKAAVATYYRGLRKAHQRAGLCGMCISPAEPGQKLCTRHQETLRARYLKWSAAGLCGGCGRARAPGRSACAGCLRTHLAVTKARYGRLRKAGRCIYCGGASRERVACAGCSECSATARRAQREAERAAAGWKHFDRGDGRTTCGLRILPAGQGKSGCATADAVVPEQTSVKRACLRCVGALRKMETAARREAKRAARIAARANRREQILDLREEGLSISATARQLNLSAATVHKEWHA